MEPVSGKKRGFLNEDFRIFHLRDRKAQKVDYHYHEFDKIVLLISGKVDYYIEGEAHVMTPGDMLFVPHGCIHMPVISPCEEYDRYVIWTTPQFLSRFGRTDGKISVCFEKAPSEGYMRSPDLKTRLSLINQLSDIMEASSSDMYMSGLMAESMFVSFMINVCRVFLEGGLKKPLSEGDPRIKGIREYIENNLSGDLSVEHLASVFFMSRYHLMRSFKAQNGYTLHQYITRRRILRAASMIGSGTKVTEAASACGYSDYSAFLRAFKSVFNASPRSFSSMSSKKDIYNE